MIFALITVVNFKGFKEDKNREIEAGMRTF